MIRTTSAAIMLAATAMLVACERPGRTAEIAAAPSSVRPSSTEVSANPPGLAPGNTGAAAEGDALVSANDRVIAENKRMIATLGRYQSEDFGKYERLRKGCEAQAHGTLADSAAPVVARCIEAGW